MPSSVTQVPAADSASALRHFESAFQFETDCWDVNDAMKNGRQDFVLLDVRSPELYARGHVPGAVNIPHGKIIESTMSRYPGGTIFVVYCAGPHCNGAHRGALRLARLGRPVKIMIGGISGWLDEQFELAAPSLPSPASGGGEETRDPLPRLRGRVGVGVRRTT